MVFNKASAPCSLKLEITIIWLSIDAAILRKFRSWKKLEFSFRVWQIMVQLFSQGYQEKYWCGEIPGTFCLWCTVYGHLMAIFWLGGPMGTSWKNPLTYAGVYCSDTLFIMQVLYRIIYCDDNVVMMPKGREQVLSSTWGANKEDTLARNPLQSHRHQYCVVSFNF